MPIINISPTDFEDDFEDKPSILPAGNYDVIVHDSMMKDYKKIDGQYLNMTFMVTDSDYAGHKIYEIFNIYHPSENAKKFSIFRLGQLVKACGIDPADFHDTAQLHEAKIRVKVVVEKNSQYGDSNKIDRFIIPTETGGNVRNTSVSDIPW